MPRLVARVELNFDADSVRDGGQKLNELTALARGIGLEVVRAEVHLAGDARDTERANWVRYTP